MPNNRAEHGEYASQGGRHRHCVSMPTAEYGMRKKRDVGTNTGTLPRCYDDDGDFDKGSISSE